VSQASGGCTGGLFVEDNEEVFTGPRELVDEWALGTGGMGAGCFSLDTSGVGT